MKIYAAGDRAAEAGYHKPKHPKDHFTFADCPLTDPLSDIRVLGLLPGRLESPIKCTLATQSLIPATIHDQNPAYEALSYVWGQEQPTDSIKIYTAGQYLGIMYITPNLSAALRQLRESNSVRFLWIDAICIDHANTQEKNRQVPLMADIYRRAEHNPVMTNSDVYDEWGHMSLQPAFRLAEIRNNVRWISRDEVDTGSLWSLETLMWKFHDFEISDPRDAIYALLALAKDRRLITHSFYPLTHGPMDHRRLYLDVFKNYIFSTTKISGSLDVLCRPWKPYEEGIKWDTVATPSWLPQNPVISIGHTVYGKYGRLNPDVLVGPPEPGKRYYNASGSVAITKACRFGTGIKSSSLFVEGLVVDAIAEKEPYALCGGERSALSDGVPDQWREAVGWIDSAKKPPDAYWRTLVANRGPNGSGTPDFYPFACREQARDRYYHVAKNYKRDTIARPTGNDALVVKFVHRVHEVVLNRRLIHTEYGRLGLAPHLAKKRDLVCIFFGCSVPIVLRRQQDAGTGEEYFQFIGECYIHGIMEGEALEQARRRSADNKIPKQEFELR